MRGIASFADELARQARLFVDANRFNWCETVAPLLSAELIHEHRRDPLGEHSPALEKVLDFVRSHPDPLAPQLVLLVVGPDRWAIAEYPRGGEVVPQVRDRTYASRAAAEHEIFLERLSTLEAAFGGAGEGLSERAERSFGRISVGDGAARGFFV
jgi:branched-chain amino acid transport system permease protein